MIVFRKQSQSTERQLDTSSGKLSGTFQEALRKLSQKQSQTAYGLWMFFFHFFFQSENRIEIGLQ